MVEADSLDAGADLNGNENPNKIVNSNQTWDTPGFKWKTEVEFIQNDTEES